MKTRTLLLLALACGLAIMLAGAVFLFQLAAQDDLAEPVPLGEPVRVGDMQVSVTAAGEQGDGRLTVEVEIGGTFDEQPADEFRLIASGRPVGLADTTCAPADSSIQACLVTFDVAQADGVSRVLFYERGDDQARWVLG
jgi:hypothetical protein